jgi:hypothetical protein
LRNDQLLADLAGILNCMEPNCVHNGDQTTMITTSGCLTDLFSLHISFGRFKSESSHNHPKYVFECSHQGVVNEEDYILHLLLMLYVLEKRELPSNLFPDDVVHQANDESEGTYDHNSSIDACPSILRNTSLRTRHRSTIMPTFNGDDSDSDLESTLYARRMRHLIVLGDKFAYLGPESLRMMGTKSSLAFFESTDFCK